MRGPLCLRQHGSWLHACSGRAGPPLVSTQACPTHPPALPRYPTLPHPPQVVTFRYGLFSHLWIDMMQRLGLDVTVIEGRWGDGAYEDK